MIANTFLGGVVEGFYGRPWSPAQRRQLFAQMSDWGLNTYFYAPKDDLKHRAIWRSCYDSAELAELEALVAACHARRLQFIYGLSPGLDLKYADREDVERIKLRCRQLMDVGCGHFALLFDDLPGRLTSTDCQLFPSLADAQAVVSNEVTCWVRAALPEARFLFCPTAYCDRMDCSGLAGRGYLETLGERLEQSIDILWTGPEIVSREIPVASIESLTARIQRRPVIWDNLHANDYDGQRLYTGPYSGRSVDLRSHVAGILVNPNNEFPINYVPLRTLAAYLTAESSYEPREAFLAAAAGWLDAFQTVAAPLTLDDLVLLCDCYYLPHRSGPGGERAVELVRRLINTPVDHWNGAAEKFQELNERIQAGFEQLTQLQDRELFYAWSRRVWDLKEELQLIGEFVAQKKSGTERPEIPSHLPGTYRGGIVAQLRSLLASDDQARFFPSQPA